MAGKWNIHGSTVNVLSEQRTLRDRSPKCAGPLVTIAADATLVKSKPFAENIEKLLLCFPVLALAAHAFAKHTGVQFSAARVTDAIQYPVGFGWKLFAQALFKIRSDTPGQAQHIDERFLSTAVFRALQEFGNVTG